MKIFILLPGLPIGGMERVAVTIANGLCERGHDVTIAAYDKGENPLATELHPGVRFVNKGLKPHPFMSRIPWVRHRWYDDGMWETRTSPERLYRYYVGSEQYDVEIAFFRGLAIKTLSASRKEYSDPPVRLAWVHTDFTKAIGYDYNFKDLGHVKKAYKEYDKVVCVSRQALDGFVKVIGDTGNLTTIYNPITVEEIKIKGNENIAIGQQKHKFNVVLVGRLVDGTKGQIRLIKAIMAVRKDGNDIGLTLVGDGPDRVFIECFISENNAENWVTLVGNQPNPYPFIKQADLLVCASYYEGFNLTVAEALALGTPVLSTRCAGPVEILDNGKYGMLVENSTEGLILGISKILQSPELIRNYQKKTTERLSMFDKDNTLNLIENLF